MEGGGGRHNFREFEGRNDNRGASSSSIYTDALAVVPEQLADGGVEDRQQSRVVFIRRVVGAALRQRNHRYFLVWGGQQRHAQTQQVDECRQPGREAGVASVFTSVVPVTCAVFPQGLEGGRAERGGGGGEGQRLWFPRVWSTRS